MKKYNLFSLNILFLCIFIFAFIACGNDEYDNESATLTINQAHTLFLSSFIITDTLGNVTGTLSGLPHSSATTACAGGGTVTVTVVDSTTDTMAFSSCQIDSVKPDTINGTLSRVRTDADSNGIAENVMMTVTADVTLDADWDDDDTLDSQVVFTAGGTIEIRGFQGGDIVDGNGKSKSNVIVNGDAQATLLGNSSTITFTDYDSFLNLQDPGTDMIMELKINGTLAYADSCITNTMDLFTHASFKLPYGPGFDQGTIIMNNIQSVLQVLGSNVWRLTIDNGTSSVYTQSAFDQLPAACP